MTRTARTTPLTGTARTAATGRPGTRRPAPARRGTGRRARTAAAAGAAVLLATALAACAEASDDAEPESRAFALTGRTLTVDSNDSALELVPADVGEVKVTRWFAGSVVAGSGPEVTWSMRDDVLKLRVSCSGVIADCAARHRIEVPRGVAVTVRDKDGSVSAKGFRTALDIRTDDGSVRVTDVTGPLGLRTADGSVHASGVRSRTVRASSDDGSVRLELAAVPDLVDARTHDGSVDIALPDGTYRVAAHSDDGSVNVSVPRADSSGHVVKARSGDGSVTVRKAN